MTTHPTFRSQTDAEITEGFEKICAMESAYIERHGPKHPLTQTATAVRDEYVAELERRDL